MAGDNEIHNDLSGQVGGDSNQIGANYGSIWMSSGSSGQRKLDEKQADLLRNLAWQVGAASDRELGTWGIRDQDALPVRWHTAADNLVDHPEKIHGSSEPVSLDGRFTKILDTYEAVPSKRLVILGAAGAGKTVLAHRLILSLLKKREAGHVGPVPVPFSFGGWNPAETELPRWLAQQLVQDFPYLEARDPITKAKQAELFIERGLILPVLDGFDEILECHHSSAINKIGTLNFPLIITSRPDEYAAAARGIKAISGAAAITLEPLTLNEARYYLCHTTSKDRAPAWDELFEQLAAEPGEPVRQNLTTVLSTPLMVVLARTVYNDTAGSTPLDLLDSWRFPTKTVVENHLLDKYVTTVYAHPDTSPGRSHRPNWNPDRARHWLGYLATHLQQRNTHDLTWWHLHTTLHRHTRLLATTTTAGLTGGLVFGLAVVLSGALVFGFWDGFSVALMVEDEVVIVFGVVVGLVVGLAVGLVNEVRFSRGRIWGPERLRLSLRRGGNQPGAGWMPFLATSTFEIMVGLLFGIVFGIAVGLTVGLTYVLNFGLTYVLTFELAFVSTVGLIGLVFGLAVGLAGVVVAALGGTSEPHATGPWTLLTRDRTVTLVKTAMSIVFVAILGVQFGYNAWIATIIVAIRLPLSAWGSWLMFARVWLPLTGRLPWRPKKFLEDANDRGVLRTTGAVYQIRHARLRDHLADCYRT